MAGARRLADGLKVFHVTETIQKPSQGAQGRVRVGTRWVTAEKLQGLNGLYAVKQELMMGHALIGPAP